MVQPGSELATLPMVEQSTHYVAITGGHACEYGAPVEPVNLFSDTQTRPTAQMRTAMGEAEVGDEQRFLDPTTRDLQERVAELLGHEAGLFLPSGTMCNLIGFRLHLRPGGDEAILHRTSHPVNYEAGSPAAISHAMTRQLDGDGGIFSPDQVEAAVRPAGDRYGPRSRLVSVEQTTNIGGGRVWPLETVRGVLEVARRHDLRTHLDGARLMNAVVASDVPASDWASGFDTAWIDFTKGLGAPVGAVLCGSRELIDEAWRWKQMLGGALRQSGVLGAACLYALDHHVERLAEDHENARVLADGLIELGLDVGPVETNIVMMRVEEALLLAGRLWDAGVQVTPAAADRIRCVTHLDVDRDGVERALAAFRRTLR
jgi:threonine aldolase